MKRSYFENMTFLKNTVPLRGTVETVEKLPPHSERT